MLTHHNFITEFQKVNFNFFSNLNNIIMFLVFLNYGRIVHMISNKTKKILAIVLTSVFIFSFALYVFLFFRTSVFQPKEADILRKAYPDVLFEFNFDFNKRDWKVDIHSPVFVNTQDYKHKVFYWAGGRLLPEEELSNKDKYWKLIYPYSKEIRDPSNFSDDDTKRMGEFGSSKNRKESLGTPMFFFDFIYGAKSQLIIEDHIHHTTFLGKKTRLHERVEAAAKRVESQIYELAKSDSEVKSFVDSIKSADAYYWRIIEGTNRKSFHSYGIAIDILPKRLNGKAIFWSWTKDKDPKNWMRTPLKDRWMPPLSVIKIFEKEGFIWGGKWIIFDNMHFEYHPELTLNMK